MDLARVEALQRLREEVAALPPEVLDVHKQHTVTKCLLRQWVTDRNGQQLVHRISTRHAGVSREVGVDGCGYVIDFVQHRSESMERFWKAEVEDRLGEALRAVEAGTLLSEPNHKLTIKKAVAMHMARNRAFAAIHDQVSPEVMGSARREFWSMPAFLDHMFYLRYSLFPAGRVARESILDELMRPTEELIQTGEYLRVRLPDLYADCLDAISTCGLMLFHAPRGNVAIGDTPALALHRDSRGLMTGGPVGYQGAGAVLLPLGPHWICVIGERDGYQEAAPEAVRTSNWMQFHAAEDHVVMRCGMWPGQADAVTAAA